MNRIPDPPPAPTPGAPTSATLTDERAAAADADLGELLLFIGRIRRELAAGSPLHCPDMKPLARRAERVLALLPQLAREEARHLLPRLERVMAELEAVEAVLRERKLVLDTALAENGDRQQDALPPGGRHRR